MTELDLEILNLRLSNSIVSTSYTLAGDELTALKLAVVAMAEAMDMLEKSVEKSHVFKWTLTGNLVICPECKMIKKRETK